MAPSVTGKGQEMPRPTAAELEDAQEAARAHADDPATGVCLECGVSRCACWRAADAVILRGLGGMAADAAAGDSDEEPSSE